MNMKDQAADAAATAWTIFRDAEAEGRDLSRRERARAEELLDKAEELKAKAETDDEIRRVSTGIGAASTGPSDPNAPIGQGWGRLGKSIDLRAGKTKAEVPLDGLMRGKAGTFPEDEEFPPFRAPMIPAGYDTRFLYPNLARQTIGPELSVAEFRQVGRADVASGTILRYPTDTSTKAELDVELELVQERMRQVAAVISDVPNAILNADTTLRAFLEVQMRVKLDQAIDQHVVAQIDVGSFAGGAVGTNLVEQIRNGIAAMKAAGTNPNIVALSPTDSVELDLFTTGADDAYVFALRDSGSSSPLFNLRVIETSAVTEPLLIDTTQLGLLYVGQASFQIDPYSGFEQNLSTVRLEGNVLFHVRNPEGCYEIGGS